MPPSTNKNEFVKIFNIVNEIFKFNEQIKWRQGLKILTLNQMLSRLPVSLTQLKAGNNSEKLKNEIRQLFFSLYGLQNLPKQLYKCLIDTILNMESIFMNSENSKTSESRRFNLDLTDKLYLKDPRKNVALANLSIYYTWKNVKSEYNNNKFKIPASTWNVTFDLPDGPHRIADIQDYFEFIIKKHKTLTENSPVQIYVRKLKTKLFLK